MKSRVLVVLALLAMATTCPADVLVLQDGRRVEGDYLGGPPRELRFMVGGDLRVFSIDEAHSVLFSEHAASQGAAPPPAREEQRYDPVTEVVFPAGTPLTAIVLEDLDSGVHRRGHRFQAALGDNLMADGVVVAPSGASLVGRVSQVEKADPTRPMGRLVLELTSISVDGLDQLIATNTYEQLGPDPQAVRDEQARRGAQTGAALGAMTGGWHSSARGAAVGGMMGWGSGDVPQAVVFTNTMIEFRLRQELRLWLER
jgi:hypothetical protein